MSNSAIILLSTMLIMTVFGLDHIQMHSFGPPILADYWTSGLHYWSFGSSSVVTDDYVRLTTKHSTAKGYFWNRHPNHIASFIANVTLRFKARSSSWFADATDGGVGLWYTAATPRHMPTQFFGNVDSFEGAGVILDHSDTISVLIGDGQQVFGSLKNDRRGSCVAKGLDSSKITLVLSYRADSKELALSYRLWLDAITPGQEVQCTVVNDVSLPLQNYFGMTGSNSEHAQAEHDIYSFYVKPLRSSDTTAQDEEELTGVHLFDRKKEQALQQEWHDREDIPLADKPESE